jgi:formate dehydrogenase subunit gamma
MRRWFSALSAVTLGLLLLTGMAMAQGVPESPGQTLPPDVPKWLESAPGSRIVGGSDTPLWRDVRSGEQGYVSIPNKQAGVLVQSGGETWRLLRNGPYQTWAGYLLLGSVALLSLFFALRGRITVDEGRSGYAVERFNAFERFVHWMTATSFVVLALTGLNLMFGRHLLLPLIGKDAFASLAMAGKIAHVYLAFAFMTGLVLIFLLWVRENLPTLVDLKWLAKGGGMIGRAHPSAWKFNAGQKVIFWLTILGGISLSLSGLQLVFPFTFSFFAKTFSFLNLFGLGLPTDLTPMAEQQIAAVWHGAMGIFMIAVIIAHIYIGTIGMEGAFEAMGTGHVDLNWAREHHDLWVEELERRGEVRSIAE